ncbi:hypothetical protein ACFL3U_02535 [Pseudomonadota bacterium]
MAGVFYLVFSSPQTSRSAAYDTNKLTQVIQRELQTHLQNLEINSTNLVTTATDNHASHDALRSIVQEELAIFFDNFLSKSESTTNVNNTPSVTTQPTPNIAIKSPRMDEAAIETAMAESNAIINAAMAAGIWSPEDTIAIMSRTAGLPSSQMQQLRKRMLDAMDQENVELEGIIPFL